MSISQTRCGRSYVEPDIPAVLAVLVAELTREAVLLGAVLAPGTAAELADLVQIMNSCHSNIIEVHKPRPREIGRALTGAEIELERQALAL